MIFFAFLFPFSFTVSGRHPCYWLCPFYFASVKMCFVITFNVGTIIVLGDGGAKKWIRKSSFDYVLRPKESSEQSEIMRLPFVLSAVLLFSCSFFSHFHTFCINTLRAVRNLISTTATVVKLQSNFSNCSWC